MVGGQASDGANNSGGAAVPGGPAGATTSPQNGGATANGAQGGQKRVHSWFGLRFGQSSTICCWTDTVHVQVFQKET